MTTEARTPLTLTFGDDHSISVDVHPDTGEMTLAIASPGYFWIGPVSPEDQAALRELLR